MSHILYLLNSLLPALPAPTLKLLFYWQGLLKDEKEKGGRKYEEEIQREGGEPKG